MPKRPDSSPKTASLGQVRIRLQSDYTDHSAVNNITSSFCVRSEIDAKSLEKSFQLVVSRHEPLHSSYRWEGESLKIHPSDTSEFRLDTINASTEEDCSIQAQDFGRKPFDLETGPILRLGLFSCRNDYHLLTLVIHDIAFDKWSLKLFWREIESAYAHFLNGETLELPLLSRSYSDFAHWQKTWLSSKNGEQQEKYWAEKLKSPPEPIPLPTDLPYPNKITDPGRLEKAKIPANLANSLRKFSADRDASLFTTLLMAFQVMLCRYAQVEDVLVSSPVANRRKKETKDLIGFFLNTLVLRLEIKDNPTIEEAFDRVRTHTLESLTFQDLPTDAIVQAIKPKRVPGRHPLFQTMFVFQREDEGTPRLFLEDCTIEPIFIETNTSKFDISLFVAESSDTFETIVEYRTDLFEPETMQSFLEMYETVLTDIVSHPKKRVQDLNIISAREAKAILSASFGSKLEHDHNLTICDLISKHAISQPSKTAILFEEKTLSYKELEEATDSFARRIIEANVTREERVAVYIERSLDAIVAILAVLKSGAAYVPIDPNYPKARNENILRDARPALIIAPKHFNDSLLEQTEISILRTDEKGSKDTPLPKIAPDSPAYLIYTSGSTGKPKGAVISHRSLGASTLAREFEYKNAPERYLLISSLSFDSSIAGIFWPLSTGNTLLPLPAGDEKDPDKIRDLISKRKVTTLLCIPSLYSEIISNDYQQLTSLRDAIVAGEACPSELVERHYSRLEHCKLHNEYGPTEATVWATHALLEGGNPITIGRPIAGYSCFVLSKHGQPLPLGIPGELFISGPGVSLGYHNQKEQSDKSFVYLELLNSGIQRCYKTGDRASYQKNGDLLFLGRVDQQIKLSGYRIEPQEIVEALVAHTNIAEAVVRIAHSENQADYLVAYLKLASSSVLDEASLRKHLAKILPPQYIPKRFITIESIPKQPNGKVDYKALPIPSESKDISLTKKEASTSTESKLLAIWKQILGVQTISTDENFFDLGGTSLQAIRLFSEIRAKFGRKLSPSRLVESPTIEHLAQLLEPNINIDGFKYLIPLKKQGHLPPIFLIHSGGLQILFYKDLADYVHDSIPLYGFQPDVSTGKEPLLRDIKAMAMAYLKELLAFQPDGPFVLLGHCFGVAIAMEMARLLKEQNKEVSLVVSIDGEAPLPIGVNYPKPLKEFPNLPPFIREIRIAIRQGRKSIRKLARPFLFKFGTDTQREAVLLARSSDAIYTAFTSYHSTPYHGSVLSFRSKDSEHFANHRLSDWERAAPDIETIQLDCGHWDILVPPNVDKTAKHIERSLAKLPQYESLTKSLKDKSSEFRKLKKSYPEITGETITLTCARSILSDSIYKKTLSLTLNQLQNISEKQIDTIALELIESASITSNTIKVEIVQLQDACLKKFQSKGIDAHIIEISNHYQFHECSLKIPYTKIDTAVSILSELGFQNFVSYSKGAWECSKRIHQHSTFINRDSKTTRVSLHWDQPAYMRVIPRKLYPTTKDLNYEIARHPLWTVYFFRRFFSILSKPFYRAKLDSEPNWPFLGTPDDLIPELLNFSGIDISDTLVDIGCGDGRIAIAASRKTGCQSIGIELDPDLAKHARESVRSKQLEHLVTIENRNALELDYSKATLVFLFLPAGSIPDIIEKLYKELSPGSRILVHEQERIQHRIQPTQSQPIFSETGITVAHLWTVENR